MTIVVTITELRQKTGLVLSRAVDDREDVIVKRHGQDYAVVVSRERYQQLIDATRAPIKERFLEAQKDVHEITAEISKDTIEEMVAKSVRESRRRRASPDG